MTKFVFLCTGLFVASFSQAVITQDEVVKNASIPVKTDANLVTFLADILASMAAYKAAKTASAASSWEEAKEEEEESLFDLFGKKEACYKDLGCFRNDGNFSNFARLPFSPEHMETGFHLYTEGDQVQPEYLNYSDPATISSSKFRTGQPIVVVIHGFGESGKTFWFSQFQKLVLRKWPLANFIAVDWAIGARQPDYWQAAANTQMTAAQIARLLFIINNVTGTPMSHVHLIGFSLGGQVAGLTSRKLIEFGLPRVGRITGLDPAGPIFENANPAGRIDEDDADFVQVIHGNGATLLEASFGMFRRVGHRDFYPNGGRFQPGCPQGLVDTLGNLTAIACNHFRAIAYALESLNTTCGFASYPCASYEKFQNGQCFNAAFTNLDIFSPKSFAKEPLYLFTNSEPSYCTRGLRITVRVSDKSPGKKGSLVLKLRNTISSTGLRPTYTILKETQFAPGKVFQEILFGRLTLEDLPNVTVEYHRFCKLLCGDNTHLNLTSFNVQELTGSRKISCGNLNLSHGLVATVPITEQTTCTV